MVLFNLFYAFLKVGLFAIGGAYSFLPLIEKEAVERYHWMTREEFLDVLATVQVFPGAISIKYATYTGYKISGIPGAIAANAGNLLAPALLMLFASSLYARYCHLPSVKSAFSAAQLTVFSMIIAVAFQTISPAQLTNPRSIIIIILSFTLFIYTKVHPAFIIICAGIAGFLL